jgi:uncharacterized protein HemX
MSVERVVVDPDAPTRPIPVQRQRTTPTTPPAPPPDEPQPAAAPPDEPFVEVSEARRSTGRLIAIALLLALIVGAVWYVFAKLRIGIPTTPPSEI